MDELAPRTPVELSDDAKWAAYLRGVKLPKIMINDWGLEQEIFAIDETALVDGYEHFDIKHRTSISLHADDHPDEYEAKKPVRVYCYGKSSFTMLVNTRSEKVSETNSTINFGWA